jgi:Ca-activated chloride channel homolog
VDWEGPNNPTDYVTIVLVGAPEGRYLSWAFTRNGSPVRLTAPSEPGDYEVRYVLGQGARTLASAPVRVVQAAASVGPPAEVAAGAAFEVDWEGPNNPTDYVTIVLVGAPEGRYLSWAFTRNGSPVRLTAPSEPGDYEVRYVLRQGARTLASAPVRVVQAAASVGPPAEVAAGAAFEVDWEGGNPKRAVVESIPSGGSG